MTRSEIREVSRAPGIDPPVTPIYEAPIDHPGAWKIADFRTPADYTIELTGTHLREIKRAIELIKAARLRLEDLQREHFDVPSLRPVIDQIRHEIEDGRGFVVVRRLPVEDYSKDEIGMIFWGIGTHLGRGLSQSVLGDRLGHVKDFSREEKPGDLPYTPHRVPVFSNTEGKVSARYVRTYVEAGEAAAGRPMDDTEFAVLDRFEEISKRPELMLEFTLQPGETYFINNYTILHARTAFADFEEEDRRRHLLRLWLEVPRMRSVHPHIRTGGIAAVPGRTPSYDWSKLTTNRN